MKLEITLNKILFLVLLYPLILFLPSTAGEAGFFLTAPYFFLIFSASIAFIFFKGKARIPKGNTLSALLFLIVISLYNFSSVRYSLPIFFLLFALLLMIVLYSLQNKSLNFKLFYSFFGVYILLSIPFLFMPQGYNEAGRFMGFVGSPTIYSGFITSIFVIISLKRPLKSLSFLVLYITTLALVYLTKTRLLLVFLILYPFVRELLASKLWFSKKRIFIIFYLITFFIYPLYNVIIEQFPGLVTLRYSDKVDSSFSLRNYLFLESKMEYWGGTIVEKLFGRGNEYSRNFVKNLMDIDLMPHNDYMRILIDWGFFGFILFSFLLYKIGTKNNFTLFLSLVYMILFYSNIVFNIFLFSTILILYFNNNEELKTNWKDYV